MFFGEWIRNLFFFAGYLCGGVGSFKKPLSPKEEKRYVAAWMGGDEHAKEVLVEHNMRLVAHIAKKYASSGVEMEDLISIGTIGLIKGIHTFRPEKSSQLVVYTARCIENEIRMYLRADRKNVPAYSLGDTIGEDKDGNPVLLMDMLRAAGSEVGDTVELRMQTEQVRRAMGEVLDAREKRVIVARYGLGGDQPVPQRLLARELGVSRSYVSRIEKRALQKLRTAMQESGFQNAPEV